MCNELARKKHKNTHTHTHRLRVRAQALVQSSHAEIRPASHVSGAVSTSHAPFGALRSTGGRVEASSAAGARATSAGAAGAVHLALAGYARNSALACFPRKGS